VVPPGSEMHFSKFMDLNMLVMTGGRERTEAEFCALYERAGFLLTRIVPTESPFSVIEGVRV
ncbi:MAG TPA: methyltransferase, partial [Pyrinomonadaceae bacterium]|nr:methyltransferase [Pyrinomonadaceae bacterium]HVS81793.1 methyltransferase [Pyrinomonadaceae bacterium]